MGILCKWDSFVLQARVSPPGRPLSGVRSTCCDSPPHPGPHREAVPRKCCWPGPPGEGKAPRSQPSGSVAGRGSPVSPRARDRQPGAQQGRAAWGRVCTHQPQRPGSRSECPKLPRGAQHSSRVGRGLHSGGTARGGLTPPSWGSLGPLPRWSAGPQGVVLGTGREGAGSGGKPQPSTVMGCRRGPAQWVPALPGSPLAPSLKAGSPHLF